MNVYKERVRRWVEDCDQLHTELIGLHKILLSSNFANDTNSVLQELSTACLRSTGSVLILIENGRHWDAELVLRSVQEGTMKYLFMLSDRSSFTSRTEEFSEALFEVSRLKTHEKVLQLIAAVGNRNMETLEALGGVLIPQEEFVALSQKYPSVDRRRIEGRWGFTQLIQALSKTQSKVAGLFPSLLHGYGMASHLLHMDAVGIGMVHERDSRPEPRRSGAHLAQTARILSDCNAYTLMRLLEVYKFAAQSADAIWEIWEKHGEIQEDFSAAQREWMSMEFP